LEIALCVGEDLTDADRRENLRHHLARCPECRAHFKRLKGMFHVLEQADEQRTYDSTGSLWPGLMSRLGQPRPRMQGPRFNGWVPFSVMAAACVLLMIVMETQPTPDTAISNSIGRGVGVLDAGIPFHQDPSREPPAVDHRQESDVFDPTGQPAATPVDGRPDSSF